MNLTADSVLCTRNCMHLRMDGHEVFVERSDMAKSHIDVMVKCSKHKSREVAVKDIEEHIIDVLFTFCASPKGCPGVTLVVGILQTKCVEKLVPLKYRGDEQAILTQKLKEDFEKNIMRRLGETKPESWNENNYSSILNYEHSWPPIPDYLPSSSELAKKLLPESEVERVTKKILEKYEHQLKRVDQISQEINTETNRDKSALKIGSEVGTLGRALETGDPCSSSSNTVSGSDTSQPPMSRVLSTLGHIRREMHQRFDGVDIMLRRIEGNMKQIVTLNQTMHSSLSSFMSKLDRMVGYAESEERSRTPKRPYLSSDNISLYKKVIARMRLGTPVRLHLMCKSMSGPHIVADQAGLDLCLERENMEWLRCIYHISSKVLYYLGKAALQIKLYRVKYRNLEEGGYAWVCAQCMSRGIRNGCLECL